MIRFALVLAVCGWLGWADALLAGEKKPPNIVFILADDLGYADLGCQGSQYYETPNINKLAKRGMRLSCFYNYQNCAPTRAALMSGQYASRTGIYTVGTGERGRPQDRLMNVPRNQTNLPLSVHTLADMLKAAGYTTGMFGKWHLGNKGGYHPSKRGFDEAIVSNGRHFNFQTNPKVDVKKGTYLADWITDRGVDFIERHKDRPFFLYLPHFAVHVPYHAKKELIEHFKSKTPSRGHGDPVYAAMIASVDQSVGRVMAKLDELGLTENTVVIFASDNGGVGSYEEIGGTGITANFPLRGGKGMLYGGGVRVPFIVHWPGHTRPAESCPVPTAHVDLYPTFMEIAKGAKPKQPLDGESLVPLLNNPKAKLKRDAIYFHFPGYLEGYGTKQWRTSPAGFIQVGDWKLMEFFEKQKLELYHLGKDIGEKNNLAEAMPEKTQELHARLRAWRESINAPMPTFKKKP